jgi:hypothetical protein
MGAPHWVKILAKVTVAKTLTFFSKQTMRRAQTALLCGGAQQLGFLLEEVR